MAYGEWMAWVKRHFALSHDMANKYMKYAVENPNGSEFRTLSEAVIPNRKPATYAPWHTPVQDSINQFKVATLVQARHNKAHALAAYAKQAKDTELMGWAIEIQVLAARRAGELLRDMPKNAGELRRGPQKVPRETTPTLASLGISKNDSSLWQQLAKIPEPEFEKRLATAGAQAHFPPRESLRPSGDR